MSDSFQTSNEGYTGQDANLDPNTAGAAPEQSPSPEAPENSSKEQSADNVDPNSPQATAKTPGVLLPSTLTSLQNQYNLDAAEAEELWNSTDGKPTQARADELKGQRAVYRQTYEKIPADLSHPLNQADYIETSGRDLATSGSADALGGSGRVNSLDRNQDDPRAVDNTRPESGPHGPFADYREVDVSDEEVSEQTGIPVEQVSEIRSGDGGDNA